MSFLDAYKPQVFADLVFEDVGVQQHLDSYARNLMYENLLLWGDYGTAKSVTAEVIVKSIFATVQCPRAPDIIEAREWEPSHLNAIKNEWNMQWMDGVAQPVTIINELDQLGNKQLDIRSLLDTMPWGRFIFTTNYLHAIDPGLRSRSDEVQIVAPSPTAWLPRATHILQANGINLPPDRVLHLLTAADGSLRDYGRALQRTIIRLGGPVAPVPPVVPVQPTVTVQSSVAPTVAASQEVVENA